MKLAENIYKLDCTRGSYAYAIQRGDGVIYTLPDDAIDGIQMIRTSGHTPGHMCFHYQNFLFAGDLVSSKNNAIYPAPSIFTPDKPATDEPVA